MCQQPRLEGLDALRQRTLQVERAHHAAVADALRFIETHALFTRTGHNGVRQVDVTGLVAARFTHRDSRAGDPDLHTHVPVANKVQTLDGRWLSIDGRLLFKAIVAASEVYNTALERRLSEALPVRFAERPSTDPGKRPVRELVGVDPAGFEYGGMQVERGMRTWRQCVERGWWPGYPAKVCYPEVKPWEMAEEQERSGLDQHGIPFDPEQLYGEAA